MRGQGSGFRSNLVPSQSVAEQDWSTHHVRDDYAMPERAIIDMVDAKLQTVGARNVDRLQML